MRAETKSGVGEAGGAWRAKLIVPQTGWAAPEFHESVDRLVEAVRSESSRAFISNVTTTIARLDVGPVCVPIMVNDAEFDNALNGSEYAGLTVSIRQELENAPPGWRRALVRLLLAVGAPVLRLFAIDRMVRLYPGLFDFEPPPDASTDFVKAATAAAIARYPTHTLKLTPLSSVLEAGTLKALTDAGYMIRVARPSYILRAGSRINPNVSYSANKYRRTSGHLLEHLVSGDDAAFARIAELYAAINLRPDRADNPAVTAAGFRELHRAGLIRVCVAREIASGAINACCIYVARDGVASLRFVAYDPNDPMGHDHYVGITSTLILEALRNGWAVRLGYGGGRAKRNRGAEGQIDYSAYYVDHLPWPRRIAWRILNAVFNRQGEPIMRAMLEADRARARGTSASGA